MCAGPVRDAPAPDGANTEDAAGDTLKRETPNYAEGKTGWYWYKTAVSYTHLTLPTKRIV